MQEIDSNKQANDFDDEIDHLERDFESMYVQAFK